ncbi:hypothetical protein PBY51_006450 [Eleginops maclovinus]|uniref:Spermatogenesis-associated protein 45 n=1 Tax=Eleginops maclovinus TaxID=56733 RepID=A0AAN8AA86_ELEMC|nr:hypothetical protein PBY51_006450 [Eleginops maclovinus]
MSAAEERALEELNRRRETWCRVEGTPQQAWDRSERRHYRKHLRSTPGLLTARPAGEHRRPRPPPSKLPERRHFKESCEEAFV